MLLEQHYGNTIWLDNLLNYNNRAKGSQHQQKNIRLHRKGLQVCRGCIVAWKSLKSINFLSSLVEADTDITNKSCLESGEVQALMLNAFLVELNSLSVQHQRENGTKHQNNKKR